MDISHNKPLTDDDSVSTTQIPLRIFTTEQLLKLPSPYMTSSEKVNLKKGIHPYQLKRLSNQLKKNTEYCIRTKMFKAWCIFRILHNQPKNYNVLNIEMVEAIPFRDVRNIDVLFKLVDSDSRIYINI